MNGYQVWKIHRAVKMHFTSKYDIFLYNGHFSSDSMDAYAKVSRRKLYEIYATKFDRPYMAVEFFLSNLIYTPSDESFSVRAWDNHQKWIYQKESLTKLISDDLEKIDLGKDIISDSMPNLLKQIVSGKIMPQTAVALDAVFPFLDTWKSKVYFGFDDMVLKLIKLKRFCKYNTDVIQGKVMEKQAEELK